MKGGKYDNITDIVTDSIFTGHYWPGSKYIGTYNNNPDNTDRN